MGAGKRVGVLASAAVAAALGTMDYARAETPFPGLPPVPTPPKLSITGDVGTATALVGDTFAVSATVLNTQGSADVNARISPSPSGLVTYGVESAGCSPETPNSSTARCALGWLGADGKGTATVYFHALAPGTISLRFSCTATWDRNGISTAAGCPGGSLTLVISRPTSDASVTFATPRGTATVGKTVSTVAVITNAGPKDVSSATLSLTLPPGVRVAATSSSRATCIVSVCTFKLLAGDAVRIAITLYVTQLRTHLVTAIVGVGASVDPASADNTASFYAMGKPRAPKKAGKH